MADEEIFGLPNEREERMRLDARYREIPLDDLTVDILRRYFASAATLYGIIKLQKLHEIISLQCPNLVTRDEFLKFAEIAKDEVDGYQILGEQDIYIDGTETPLMECEVIDNMVLLDDEDKYDKLKAQQDNKPFYIPEKELFLSYSEFGFYEKTAYSEKLKAFLITRLGMTPSDAEEAIWDLSGLVSINLQSFDEIFSFLSETYGVEVGKTIEDVKDFMNLFEAFSNNSRMQCNRGYTPMELQKLTEKPKKVGRNDPCPCGSGKKYKHCCGR